MREALEDPAKHHGPLLNELSRRIRIRREQEAFHPNATQYTLHFGDAIFAFWRESLRRDQSIFALHNVSDQSQYVSLVELNLITSDTWRELLSGDVYQNLEATIELPPYGCVWITNK
jgi:sucrose phosphorylase